MADSSSVYLKSLTKALDAVQSRPRFVLIAALVTAAVGYALALHRIRFCPDRADLLPSSHPVSVDFRAARERFDRESDVIVAVAGAAREAVVPAVEHLAAELRRRPELFAKVLHRIDMDGLHRKGLQQLPEATLVEIERRLELLRPLLAGPAALAPELAWGGLTLPNVLRDAQATETRGARDRAALAKLAGVKQILAALVAMLSDPVGSYYSPWGLQADELPPQTAAASSKPVYLSDPTGRTAVVRALPIRDSSTFVGLAKPVAELRRIAADARTKFPHLEIGLTGLPILEDDEMQAAFRSGGRASMLEFVAVAVVFVVGFRGLRHPAFGQLALVVAGGWTLGFVALAVGRLNILSIAFLATLLGMGVDFGIVWLTQYEFARRLGRSSADANRTAMELAGPGVVSGALTTALAFFASALVGFQGLRDMGIIAGAGILFCLAATFVVLPALLTLWPKPVAAAVVARGEARPAFAFVAARPRGAVVCGLLAAVGGGLLLPRLRGDFDLLHLQSPGLESVQWEHRLLRETGSSGWCAWSVAESPEEARRRRIRFERLPTVERVVDLGGLLAKPNDDRMAAIGRIRALVANLPERLPPAAAPAPTEVNQLVSAAITETSDRPLAGDFRELANSLAKLPAAEAETRLARFQETWRQELFAQLRQLRSTSNPDPLTLSDLPTDLAARLHGANGTWLLQIYPKGDVWEPERLSAFVRSLRAVDPRVTGEPVAALFGLAELAAGFSRAAWLALGAVFVACWIDLGKLRYAVLALVPLLLGCTAAFGLLGALGGTINPANLVALPLIFGLGVDFGVHVLHDYRRQVGDYRLPWRLARALLLTTATTSLGFACLLVADHRGMASIGSALALGVVCSAAAALFFLPALLQLLPRHARPATTAIVAQASAPSERRAA